MRRKLSSCYLFLKYPFKLLFLIWWICFGYQAGFLVPLSSICAYLCWKIVLQLIWLFFSFLVLFSWAWFQDLDQDWKQRLGYSSQWLFSEFWKMSLNQIFSRRWLFFVFWKSFVLTPRYWLTFLSIMIVMSTHPIYLRGNFWIILCLFSLVI